ncbi:MAG: DUF3857 domain-containing protein [Candidatus Latescibacteria bacterium]|nr:DUF3857 domain-containing protein [bacterium]MBD3423610.1 DUF3857 domain-containing protein [Candidatus Latescibacterota bacterium]
MNRKIATLFNFLAVLALVITLPANSRAGDNKLPPGEKPAPDLFSRLEEAGTAEDHQGAEYLIVFDSAVNRVKQSGVTYVDKYTICKVLTPEGSCRRSVLRWHYEPQSSYVDVREVNIVREGKKIPVDISAIKDLPAPQRMIYWRDRIKILQLPRLQVNDGIEVRTFRKGFTYALLDEDGPPGDEKYIPPMPGEYFDIVLFSGEAPILEKRYTLILPPGKKLHSEIYNQPLYSSTSYQGDTTRYEWFGFDLPARVHEPRQPGGRDIYPKVVMATVEDWEAKSRWFFDVNSDQFEVTGPIREKVEEIFREKGLGKASEARKAKALLHWTAQNIRYSGQTMGEGEGFTLHPGSMIFEQRSGVCKDIAGMLITLMRAAGMDSYAAMTMAGSGIEEVPADQFNHCVVALRKEDGSFVMYDPTWVGYNNNIWSLLETEQDYLIGTPKGESLARIPYSPPSESPLIIEHRAELSREGDLEGEITLSASGASDGSLRDIVSRGRRRDLDHTFAQLLAPVSDRVEEIEYEYPEPDDFSTDMWIRASYRIPRFALVLEGAMEFRSPVARLVMKNGRLSRAAGTSWGETRQTDILLYSTQLLRGEEVIKIPRGYELVDPPSTGDIDETYAFFSGESRMDGRKIIINQHMEVRRRQIPPSGYPGFKKAMDGMREWGEKVFRVEKGGSR